MDPDSKKMYELSLNNSKEIPEIQVLLTFLEKRFQSLESLRAPQKKSDPEYKKKEYLPSYHSQAISCPYCNSKHSIFSCTRFTSLSVEDRHAFANKKGLCNNCLHHNKREPCRSYKKCLKCKKQHHTLLHKDNPSFSNISTPTSRENQEPLPKINRHAGRHLKKNSQKFALLATAYIEVKGADGDYKTLRALIDPGSQISFISEAASQRLGLPRQRHCLEISGIGSTNAGTSKWKIYTILKPRFSSSFACGVELLILPRLTNDLPHTEISCPIPTFWNNLCLADPNFNTPSPIDILIGVDIYTSIIQNGIRKSNGLIAQRTTFGWIPTLWKHDIA